MGRTSIRRSILAAPAALVVLSLFAGPAAAATFNVNSTLDEPDANPGDGVCASTPSGVCTLRAAVDEANNLNLSDTIVLPAGTYNLTTGSPIGLGQNGNAIYGGVTLQGASARTTIISGLNATAVLTSDNEPSFVSDVTVRDGFSNGGFAAGIVNNSNALTLTRVAVLNNHDLPPQFSDISAFGGGIGSSSGTLTIRDSLISGNSVSAPDPGNIAMGGGVYVAGDALIENSTIAGNSAGGYHGIGGGIGVDPNGTSRLISNSTVTGNSASGVVSGTAIGGEGGNLGSYAGGTATVKNTIVAQGTASDPASANCNFTLGAQGQNLEDSDTCGLPAGSNTNPLLGPLQDNGGPTDTRAPLAGSPAIDAGAACTPDHDQRLLPRPVGAACDIGAVEVQDADVSVALTDAPDPVTVGDTYTYTATVTNNGPLAATATTLTLTLPPGTDVVSAPAGCTGTGPVTCNLGTVNAGANATVNVVVRPTTAGDRTGTASASSSLHDPNPANNTASTATHVNAPPASNPPTDTTPPPTDTTPPPTDTTPVVPPRLSSLRVSPIRFHRYRRVRRRLVGGARVTYRLTQDATVKFSMRRLSICRFHTRTLQRRCNSLRSHSLRFKRTSHRGLNGFRLTGKVGRVALLPGRYRLAAKVDVFAVVPVHNVTFTYLG